MGFIRFGSRFRVHGSGFKLQSSTAPKNRNLNRTLNHEPNLMNQ